MDSHNSDIPNSISDGPNGSSYLTSCSKVALEAYDRVLAQIKAKKDEEEKNIEHMMRKTFLEEQSEKAKKEKLRLEQEKVKEILAKQVLEKKQKEKLEKTNMKSEFVKMLETQAVFPKIIEPPVDLQINKRRQSQEEVKKNLQDQILENEARRRLEKLTELHKDQENLRKVHDELNKDQDSYKQREKEKREKFCADLRESLQAKELLKATQKKLDNLKAEDLKQEENKSQNSENCENIEENKEQIPENKNEKNQDIELIEKYFENNEENGLKLPKEGYIGSVPPTPSIMSDDRQSKFEQLLEKKKLKAHNLLQRIENLEKTVASGGRSISISPEKKQALEKMKEQLSSQAFSYIKDGKKIRVEQDTTSPPKLNPLRQTPKSVRSSKSHRSSMDSTLPAKNNYERTMKLAFQQCLAKIESQADEEQRKILDLLKKEQDRERKIDEEKIRARQNREHCKKFVLQQIEDKRAKKLMELKSKVESQDIEGNMGYPPIKEPNPDERKLLTITSCKKQSEIYEKQIKEKEEIRKRQLQAEKANLFNAQNKQEEEARKQEILRIRENQRKWKETWDVENMISRLKITAEAGPNKARLHLAPMSPQKLPKMSNEGASRSRSHSGAHGFFVTSADLEDGGKTKYKGVHGSVKKEMWANKAA